MYYLSDSIKTHLNPNQDLFDQVMALSGERYRDLEGRITQRIHLGDKTYFIKQHFGVGWKEIFKNLFQGRLPVTSAKNEWLAIKKLEGLGVAVPKILGYGQRGINPAKKESFILMEDVAPSESLETICATWGLKSPPLSEKRKLIQQVAKITKTLHENGINHRDLYLCHFLKNNQGQLYLIDLHRAQIRPSTPKRWVVKDLSGLYFSSMEIGMTKQDWFRFIQVYRDKPLREIVSKESEFWKRVKERGRRLHHRLRRR